MGNISSVLVLSFVLTGENGFEYFFN